MLALCGCGTGAGPLRATARHAPEAAASADGARPATALPDAPPDGADATIEEGRYAGLSILTAFHGDCNAGGTGEIVVQGGAVTYRDALNPVLSGRVGADGGVDLAQGRTHLTGGFAAKVFTGRIVGGPCEYQMRFEHVAGQDPAASNGVAEPPRRRDGPTRE